MFGETNLEVGLEKLQHFGAHIPTGKNSVPYYAGPESIKKMRT